MPTECPISLFMNSWLWNYWRSAVIRFWRRNHQMNWCMNRLLQSLFHNWVRSIILDINVFFCLSVTCNRSVVFSTNKTDHHDITEILLKVVFNTIHHCFFFLFGFYGKPWIKWNDLLHIPHKIVNLCVFNQSYFPYNDQTGTPFYQEQWKGKNNLSIIF